MEGAKKVTTDLVLMVSDKGYYQEFEAEMYSHLQQESVARPHLRLLFPESIADCVVNTVKETISKSVVHMVNYTLGIGAKVEHFQAKAIPLFSNQALLLIQNITNYRESEKDLQAQVLRLQDIIDGMVAVTPAPDKVIYSSGDALYSADVPAKQSNHKPEADRICGDVAVPEQATSRNWNAGIAVTHLATTVLPVQNNSQPDSRLATEQGISDVQSAQTRLNSKLQDLDLFMYRASHDLKSPLAAMEGVLSLLTDHSSEKQKNACLELIRKSHRALSTIVNDLNCLTRISGKKIRSEVINLSTFVHEITDTLSLLPEAKNIKLKACVQEHLFLTIDAGLLRSVLQNLITNAVIHHRSTDDERFVLITILSLPSHVIIEVTDNGNGIPKAIQDKIYNVFFRGNVRVAGSGLGLYIANQAVEKLGGTINLISEEGVGSTFTVTIPKVRRHEKD